MTLRIDVSALRPDSRIELFQVDMTPIGGGMLHFHAGTNQRGRSITFQGIDYLPAAIEAKGFECGEGQVARPTLTISNINGVIAGYLFDYDDMRGAVVTRIRTYGKYLDAINYPNGNPSADPAQQFAPEIYEIDRVRRDDGIVVEFELGAPHDVLGEQLPSRVVADNLCDAIYRSGEICDWEPDPVTGPFFDRDNSPTTAEGDACNHCISGCLARHTRNLPLPLGAFPGAGLIR